MEATGVALDREALAALDVEFAAEIDAPRAGDLRRRRPRVQPRQPQAARADPVLRAEPAQGQARRRPATRPTRPSSRSCAAGPPDDRQAPRVADLHEAPLDVRRGAADAHRRRRPAAHDVPPGRGRDRPAVVVGPEPPEHPDPDAARAADPAGVRGRGAGRRRWSPRTTRQIELRILAHVSGDEHLRDAFAREADIHRETAARVLHKAPEDVTRGRALDGQDGQLRDRLRDERLRAVQPGRTSRARRPRSSSTPTSRRTPGSATTCSTSRSRPGQQGFVTTLLGRKRSDPRARRRATRPCAAPASGWRSTCRSRARPPTS